MLRCRLRMCMRGVACCITAIHFDPNEAYRLLAVLIIIFLLFCTSNLLKNTQYSLTCLSPTNFLQYVLKSRRVARIWKMGGYFERVRSVQTTLTRIFIDLESISDGLSETWGELSRKFKAFFRPKLGDLQKKKKVFAKIQSDFSAEIRNSKLFSAEN